MNQSQDDRGSGTRKRYLKPEIKKVELTPEEAVLGACKNGGNSGPAQPTCNFPSACGSMGS